MPGVNITNTAAAAVEQEAVRILVGNYVPPSVLVDAHGKFLQGFGELDHVIRRGQLHPGHFLTSICLPELAPAIGQVLYELADAGRDPVFVDCVPLSRAGAPIPARIVGRGLTPVPGTPPQFVISFEPHPVPAHQFCAGSTITEPRSERAPANSLQAADRFQAMIEQAPLSIALFDRNMNYIATSRRWLEQFCPGHSSVIGCNHYEVIPDIPERWKQVNRDALAGRPQGSDNDLWSMADGSRRWLRWAVHPWTDESGSIAGVVVYTEDLTGQETALAAQRESSKRYRDLVEHMVEGYTHCRLLYEGDQPVDFEYLEVNPAFYALTGRRNVVGKRGSEMFPGLREERPQVLAYFHQTVSSGHTSRFEVYLKPLDKWINVAAYRVGADEFVTMFDDITERKRGEENVRALNRSLEVRVEERTAALSENERALQAILDSIPGMVAYWDTAQRNLFANRIAESWRGLPRGGMLGRTLEEIVGSEFYQVLAPHVQRALSGTVQQVELQPAFRGTSAVKHMLTHYVPDIADGSVRGFLSLSFDITRLKQAEEAAAAASRAKSAFVANMSHEIRTPLNAVLGLAELGMRSPDTAKVPQYFRTILESGRHLLELINDILDFSKIEAGKLELHSEQVDLAALLDDVVLMLGPRARAGGLTFMLSEEADVPQWFRGDSTRCRQILLNLLSNAIKFTEKGEIALHVGRRGDFLILRVSDTGIGIAPDDQERLFNAFEQADGGITRRFGGTGLGLSITRQLVALMHGTISVSSDPGRGSTFEVTLPLAEPTAPDWQALGTVHLVGLPFSEATALERMFALHNVSVRRGILPDEGGDTAPTLIIAAEAYSTPPGPSATDKRAAGRFNCLVVTSAFEEPALAQHAEWPCATCRGPLSPLRIMHAVQASVVAQPTGEPRAERLAGLRILAAEDNALNRMILEDMLLEEGAHIAFAENGAEAVATLRDAPHAFDVVLCDVEMPVMNGYEATVHMRQISPDVPIIALTAHAFEQARRLGDEAGMNDYLTKPYTQDELVQTIRAAVLARR